jgi:NADH-quinone oxidoreductase subunit L
MTGLMAFIPFAPAASALLLILFGRRYSRRAVSLQACLAVLASFLLSFISFLGLTRLGPGSGPLIKNLFPWVQSGAFQSSFALRFDSLTAVMTLVVTGVGFLIHLYSVGYMSRDKNYARYFAHLNLFTFAMLLLVMSSNLVLMFVGWEGVGLCSYLLIGFWFEKPSASRAGQKAFVVNRVGDSAFIIGILFMLFYAGSTDFLMIDKAVLGGSLTPGVITAIALLLFAGACGKSAQIPLYVWLPDAMEGPTPVSALIHAATMVTAGVYMVCRLSVLYSASETALHVVGWVGGLTALLAATMALVQTDIKKVLAYSTISQIGYMFIGCGAGAYAAGIFHLFTHAFFKSLLFLAAGSVIHALSGEQDMRNMGGLRAHLPRTYPAFLVGALAIAGVPFLSGFFSKDAILSRAFAQGQYAVWALGLGTAVLTAFYIFRLLFLTFFGSERLTPKAKAHLHESPAIMTAPLIILAALAVFAGYIGLPSVFGHNLNTFANFLGPAVMTGRESAEALGTEWLLLLVSVAAALGGLGLAYLLYRRKPGLPAALVRRFPRLYALVHHNYYVDEVYGAILVNPLLRGSEAVYTGFDLKVIDGAVNGSAAATSFLAKILSRGQTGLLKDYALVILAGLVIILGFLLW